MNFKVILVLIGFLISNSVFAHGEVAHEESKKTETVRAKTIKAKQKAFGIAGNPNKISRTFNIEMSDAMRFMPKELEIKKGETIKFVIKNSGKLEHEMVLGTMAELKAHSEMMKKNPEMEHNEPYMVHVAAGESGEMIWRFNKAGDFNFACLMPGHFEAGMVGKIKVSK